MTTHDTQPAERYAALWIEAKDGDDARLYLAATEDSLNDAQKPLDDAKLIPRTLDAVRSPDGLLRYSGVWGKPPCAWRQHPGLPQPLRLELRRGPGPLQRPGARRRRGQRGRQAVVGPRAGPSGDRTGGQDAQVQARRHRCPERPRRARLRLGENDKALEDLSAVIAKSKDDLNALELRAIAQARLGKKEPALADLARYQKDVPARSWLYLKAVVAAELGDGADAAIDALEAALRKEPGDFDLRYSAAIAFALASKAIDRNDHDKARTMADRSLALLQEGVRDNDVDFALVDDSWSFDPIRDDPAFAKLLDAGHPERRFCGVWSSEARFEAATLDALDPAEHLRRGRDLARKGYRPVEWSVARTSPEGPLLSASLWHRPLVAAEAKDRLAERQARAAVALVRLGKADSVWPLLRHSADPRLRSFIVNWLNPLGADPHAVAAELDRIDPNTRPNPEPGQPAMDAVFFHPETSQRRALILALGTYGTEGLSPGEREPLAAKLLAVYRDDPDAGVHGAAAWTLRQWGLKDKLVALDAELARLREPGGRRWYVNGQGQTFAVIAGPVEFRMGSPADEPERVGGNYDQEPRRMTIPRRYAIAATEVTISQFQTFLKVSAISIPRYNLQPGFLAKFSQDPDGPWVAPDWYTAAHYCNWLSQQEGLPKEQWCYEPAGEGGYAEGMMIPANVLLRTGYRLPTNAEWEYACRSGTITSRYYGASTDLLSLYARWQGNSREHAWACGSLLPNELGLFDMLGNQYEWVNDKEGVSRAGRHGSQCDNINTLESISDKSPRILRGGAFSSRPAVVRSANRLRSAPGVRLTDGGIRPSRTYP